MEAKVAIVGMGGLGCPAAQSLITAGIGFLKIIDGDTIALSNLHRQHLYSLEDLGKKKVDVAKKALEKLSNHAIIDKQNLFLKRRNGRQLLNGVDVIIDATDNIATRQLIDYFSKEMNIPMIYGSLYRFEGQVGIFNVEGAKGYSDLFPKNLSGGKTCDDAGVLGMLPSIIGNIQALETLKIITDLKPNLVGRLLIYDGLNHITEIIEL